MIEAMKSLEQSPPMTTPEQTKKVPPRGTAERREYDRLKKAASRSRKKLAVNVLTAEEWRDQFPKQHPAQQKELNEYAAEFAQTVLSELQTDPSHTRYSASYAVDACLDQVARTLRGLERNLVKDVEQPQGQMVAGMYFADVLGESIVCDSHRFGLEQSPTFSAAYRELLKILDTKYGDENTKDARVIKAELDGTYVIPIPVAQQPIPEPAPPQPRLPSDAEVLAESRARLLESLGGQLPADAYRYLNGAR